MAAFAKIQRRPDLYRPRRGCRRLVPYVTANETEQADPGWLDRLLSHPEVRLEIAKNAREWVQQHREAKTSTDLLVKAYSQILQSRE